MAGQTLLLQPFDGSDCWAETCSHLILYNYMQCGMGLEAPGFGPLCNVEIEGQANAFLLIER